MITVTESHGLPAIELHELHKPEWHDILRQAVMCQVIGHPSYELGKRAGAFLQGKSNEGDKPTWTLVEFWQPEYEPFVSHLNAMLTPAESA